MANKNFENKTLLKEDSQVIVDIKRLGINGEGIAYYKKLAVFVDNAIPGEGIDVKITKILPHMAFATPVRFMHESPSRVKPTCPYYNECGGCQVQHIDYKAMLSFKRDLISEAISRYTKLNPRAFEIKNTYGMENPYHYRFKSSLPVGIHEAKMSVGLINPTNKKLTLINTCEIQNDILNDLNKSICNILDEEGVTAKNPITGKGDISYIVCRVSHYNNEAQVTLITSYEHAKLDVAAKKIMALPHVVGVSYSYNDSKKEEAIFGPKTILLEGKSTICENIGKYKFELSPEAFFQLNPVQTENLYEFVKKACKLSKKETVLDLYCGAGTIGIYISELAKKVIGVEYNKQAVENAKENAKLNKVNNIDFYAGKVDDVLPILLKKGINVDVLVCDPPRTGLGEDVCKTILKNEFKRVVYVSCNPATLAKDLNLLSEKYKVNYIQPVDMFPFTSHVETVVLMSKVQK